MNHTIAIAGATGFVGSSIINCFKGKFEIKALTRSLSKIRQHDSDDKVTWVHCSSHSQKSVMESLEGVDTLIYLIHSMVPTSRLTQASFQDLDILLADNFGKAAKEVGVKKIIYISGLFSEGELSQHLASRYEVERTLASHEVPLTTLRCGLIMGPGGSSMNILLNLVRRLPVMVIPSWAESKTQPVAVSDVLRSIEICISSPDEFIGSFDIGCHESMSYESMMSRTAKIVGRDLKTLHLPCVPIFLSKRWVSVFGGASMNLVNPLIDSLRHNMVVSPNRLQDKILNGGKSFDDAVKESMVKDCEAIAHPRSGIKRSDSQYVKSERRVRSVQRLPLPAGKDAQWVLEEYMRWLGQAFGGIIRCERSEDQTICFKLMFIKEPLLTLQLRDSVDAKRQVLMITGGSLANIQDCDDGRLEFRVIPNTSFVMAAIHDFCPSLPWYFYSCTQALAHLFVMNAFGRHLSKWKTE